MSLVDEKMESCVMRIPALVPDGEGGQVTTWTDGGAFRAAIVYDDKTTLSAIANATNAKAHYTVTIPTSARLIFHDVFKRLSDGAVFRVTSADSENKKTPPRSSFQFCQVIAEEWEEAT